MFKHHKSHNHVFKNINDLLFFEGIILTIVSFLLLPFFTVLIAILVIILTKTKRDGYFYILIILLSLFLGGLNASKTPASDLEGYKNAFLNVENSNFIDYVFNSADSVDAVYGGIEPLYYLLSYLIYYIFGNSFEIFILIISFVGYLFIFFGIYKYFKNITNNTLTILSALCIIAFFNQYFYTTAHLVRQVLSFSIMFYCLAENSITNNKNVLLAISSVLIHSSTLFFMPFLFLPMFKNKITISLISKILPLVIIMYFYWQIVLDLILKITSFTPLLGYVFIRLNEGTFDDGQILDKSILFMMSFSILSMTFFVLYFSRELKKSTIYFFNILIILVLFVLSTSNAPLIQYRFFFMIYCFIPLVLPQIFIRNRVISNATNMLLIVFFIGRFFLTLPNSAWKYASIDDIVLSNYYSLLLTNQ